MNKRILSLVLSLALLLSAAGVCGITASAAEVTVTPVTEMPAGSLLAGMRPVSGVEGQTAIAYRSGTPDMLTDGVFADSANNGRWMDWSSRGGRLTFNMGAATQLSQFLVGSEGGVNQYVSQVKIYVSATMCDPRTALYVEDNLVVDATGLTAQNNLFTLSGDPVTAMMVGFDFTGCTQCTAGKQIRLGELGAYGTQNAVVADTAVNPVTAIPTETNLLKTATATINNSGGNDGLLTDGVLCTDTATRWQCATYRWGNQTWDLGDIYDIDKVLIGSEYGSEQFVKFVNIYVSNDKATLFTADTLVLSANGFYSGIGANKDNLLSSASDKAIQGRYVGFEFTNNSTYNGGHMASFLRLGELGVYGTKTESKPVVEAKGAQVRGTDKNGNIALRFGFDLTADGVAYADEAPVVNNNYVRDLSAATVTVDGTAYTLVDFGAVLSLNADSELTLDEATADTTGTVKAVAANNLYGIDGDKVTYTAVVTNIPTSALGTLIYARPYVTYTDGTVTHTVYGTALSRTVNGCTADAIG